MSGLLKTRATHDVAPVGLEMMSPAWEGHYTSIPRGRAWSHATRGNFRIARPGGLCVEPGRAGARCAGKRTTDDP
jgi:hypothetical protein